jgi:hypothetical protein
MNSVTYSMQRGLAMGMKYGLRKGFRAFKSDEATPEMDETAMQGAIGIIIAVGGVLIALYIIAVVVGSISYAVTSGNIKLSPTWNSTITNIDSQAQATFNLANVLPIAIIGVGTISMLIGIYMAIYPYDRDRCLCWPGRITSPVWQTNYRTNVGHAVGY